LLVILLGIGVVQAASASLVSVLTSSLLGSSLYWSDGHAVFIYAAFLALGTAVGSFLGTSLAPQMSEAVLKKVFACLTLLTAMALLSKEVMPTSVSLVILVFGSTLLLIVALSAKLKKSPD